MFWFLSGLVGWEGVSNKHCLFINIPCFYQPFMSLTLTVFERERERDREREVAGERQT